LGLALMSGVLRVPDVNAYSWRGFRE